MTFQNSIDLELITPRTGRGRHRDRGRHEHHPGGEPGIPVVYGTTVYARFERRVRTRGQWDRQRGRPGASIDPGRRILLVMLQALLASAGLTTDDVEVVTFPDFGQGVAVAEGQVDAAVGFANNEPVQLEVAGIPVVLLRIDDVAPLPGPGLTVGCATLAAKGMPCAPSKRRRCAMEDIVADPEVGVRAAVEWLPELGDDEAALATQRAVLEATVDSWTSDDTDANGWAWSRRPRDWESATSSWRDSPTASSPTG